MFEWLTRRGRKQEPQKELGTVDVRLLGNMETGRSGITFRLAAAGYISTDRLLRDGLLGFHFGRGAMKIYVRGKILPPEFVGQCAANAKGSEVKLVCLDSLRRVPA